MDMLQIAGYLLILNIVFSLVGGFGIFSTEADNVLGGKVTESDITDSLDIEQGDTDFTNTVFESTKYLTASVNLLFRSIYQTTIGLPKMLQSTPFNFPKMWVDAITTFQVTVYSIGLAMFLRGLT